MEWFKPVKGFEKYYLVAPDGAVLSLHKSKPSFIIPHINKATGYLTMILCDSERGIRVTKTLHRIVAETWVDNPNGYECVNHKNENKLDNHASNLEWCTKAYNNTYNGKAQRCCKKVAQIDLLTNEIVKVWNSARDASQHIPNCNYKNISAVCRGKRNKCGGYGWRFA